MNLLRNHKDRSRTERTDTGFIVGAIRRARRILYLSSLLRGLLVWLLIGLGSCQVLFLLDNWLHLPSGMRLALAGVIVAGFAVAFGRIILRAAGGLQRPGLTALYLEERFQVPENFLINALQFEQRILAPAERPFAQQTIRAGVCHLREAPWPQLWQPNRLTWMTASLLLVLALWSFYIMLRGPLAANALARYLHPLADIPPAGSVRLEIHPDRDISLAQGNDLAVSVRLICPAGDSAIRPAVRIVWQDRADYIEPQPDRYDSAPMQADPGAKQTYLHTFSPVRHSFAFRIFAADTYSRCIRVRVRRLPRIEQSLFHVLPPAYTGQPRRTTPGPPEPLTGLPDAQVIVQLKLDQPVEQVVWHAGQETLPFTRNQDTWQLATRIPGETIYAVDARPTSYSRPVRLAEGPISLREDLPGRIEFAGSEGSRTATPGAQLRFTLEAADDYGIRQIGVTLRPLADEASVQTIQSWDCPAPPDQVVSRRQELLLSLDAGRFVPGTSYILEAFCHDFCPGGRVGRSQPVLLHIRSLDEVSVMPADLPADAFTCLDEAISAQTEALGVTRNLRANLEDILKDAAGGGSALAAQAAACRDKQEQVAVPIDRALRSAVEPLPDFVRRMGRLRDQEHARVVTRIRSWQAAASAPPADLDRQIADIERIQSYILAQLIACKGRTSLADGADTAAAAENPAGQAASEDYPVWAAAQSLDHFVQELRDFLAGQGDILRQRRELMDTPPEDFTTAQQEAIDSLAWEQTRLADVLSDAVQDFTNQNLLDFADPALIEQSRSIYQQADELADQAQQAAQDRQARVDAHRLETETVEMAEEILINCEAVLGYYDAIQFIAEIPEDEQLVAPLAELPSELEDLVGDLITSQEEMRPEVEDIGQYLNSLDHTAGPVSDGTISSTSAKGVTGDQKPESNVIQGRSGAGRSGMSDGQMVESVAKDLHDNEYSLPERISSTPLEGGLVRDQDVDAQTGGTGLGKGSDHASVFGAGGQLPPAVLDRMKAAALTQQVVRQRAVQLIAKVRQHRLEAGPLEASVQAMESLETALTKGDGPAIRQAYQKSLDHLESSRLGLEKQLIVRYRRQRDLARQIQQRTATDNPQRYQHYQTIIGAYFEALAKPDHNDEPLSENED
ncbi:MAG: hypothetical protein JW810_10725 [Sedimentisphaerales bacterium]|nr:hypothetical protein [Sedimentisphaerales bacterium]